MIRDPSDGSVRLRQEALPDAVYPPPGREGIGPQANEINNIVAKNSSESITGFTPVIDTSTSGLPITAKESYLAQLEESRKWLKAYVRPTING